MQSNKYVRLCEKTCVTKIKFEFKNTKHVFVAMYLFFAMLFLCWEEIASCLAMFTPVFLQQAHSSYIQQQLTHRLRPCEKTCATKIKFGLKNTKHVFVEIFFAVNFNRTSFITFLGLLSIFKTMFNIYSIKTHP